MTQRFVVYVQVAANEYKHVHPHADLRAARADAKTHAREAQGARVRIEDRVSEATVWQAGGA
jgi:hypothetical protein